MADQEKDISKIDWFKFKNPRDFIEGKTIAFYITKYSIPAILIKTLEGKEYLVGLTSGLQRIVSSAILNEDLAYDTHIKIIFTEIEKVANGDFMHFELQLKDNKNYTTHQNKPLTLKAFISACSK